jgi:hypothetical protein
MIQALICNSSERGCACCVSRSVLNMLQLIFDTGALESYQDTAGDCAWPAGGNVRK